MLQALTKFCWFLGQVTLSGATWFWIPFIVIVGALTWIYLRSERTEYWKQTLLALLPAMWIFIGLWGGYFFFHGERAPFVLNPRWVQYPIFAGVWIYLAVATGLIIYLRGMRLFVVLFALLNLYFMLLMSFIALMAVTGDWL